MSREQWAERLEAVVVGVAAILGAALGVGLALAGLLGAVNGKLPGT